MLRGWCGKQVFSGQTDQFGRSSVNNLYLTRHRLNIEAFESSRWRLHINQRALINRQDANQERPASRSIGGLPETFRSCSPQSWRFHVARWMHAYACSCSWSYVCAHSRLQLAVQQQGYPRVRLMLSSFEIERRSCEDWKAAIPGADRPRCLGVDWLEDTA